MNIEHPTFNAQHRTGGRINHKDRKEHNEGQTEDPGKVFEFFVFFTVNLRVLCLLLLSPNPPGRVGGSRVQLQVDITIMEMKNRTSFASGWFFRGYQRRRRNFTIFHHIFQSEGLEISGFTKKEWDISLEGRVKEKPPRHEGTKEQKRMNIEQPTSNVQLRNWKKTLPAADLAVGHQVLIARPEQHGTRWASNYFWNPMNAGVQTTVEWELRGQFGVEKMKGANSILRLKERTDSALIVSQPSGQLRDVQSSRTKTIRKPNVSVT